MIAVMNNFENQNEQIPSTDELQKEIRRLKRQLSLAELNLARARQVNVAHERVESLLNASVKKELQFFNLILENATSIFLLFDFDGRFAYASRTFLRDAGIANFGLISGRHFEEVLRPIIAEETISKFIHALNTAVSQKGTVTLEEQIDFSQKGELRTFSILITPMLDDNSNNVGIMALFNDITELKTTIAKMRETDHLLDAVNRMSAELLKAKPDTFENDLWQAMGIIADAVNVDRVFIWKNYIQDENLYCSQIYVWSEGAEPQQNKGVATGVPYSDMGNWEEVLSNNLCINSLVRDLSEEEQAGLSPQGILSIFVVPMFMQNQFWGFIGFDDCHRERLFTDNEEIALRSVSLALVNAVYSHEQSIRTLEADERTQIMLDAMPLCANFWDANLNNIDCNQEAVKLFELSSKQEYLDRFHDLSPESQSCGTLSKEKKLDHVSTAFKEGYNRFEWVHQKLDGELIHCEIILVRVKHKDDHIVTGYTRDLRELKSILDRLNSERERSEDAAHWYKSILDAIPLPVSVTDTEMKWTYINKATEDHLGKKREDIIGLPCSLTGSEICNTEDCGIMCIRRGIKQTFFTHNGLSYQANIEILTNLANEIAGYIEIVQDVTTLQNLARERAEAEAASNAKSSFLAMMSHEIRTPMNAILGIAEIQLQDELLVPSATEAFGKIYSSANTLLRIINDILDLSKIEAGKLGLIIDKYDIATILNDTAQLNMMRINSKPIEFRVEVDENTPKVLLGDELRIKQILNNLLSNAFKYTERGEVKLEVSAEFGNKAENTDMASVSDVTLIFRVSDTGQGMTQEQVHELFEKYSRFNLDINRAVEGAGLGMNITQDLIKMMNGEIFVESEPGKGSKITVYLPQKDVGSGVLGKELSDSLRYFRMDHATRLKRTKIVRKQMSRAGVLIVDDVETNLYVAKGLMQFYGLSVDTVLSGQEAIDKLNNGDKYDMVFMDHMMPEMDGIETVALIRQMGETNSYFKNLPIVALTANAVAGTKEMFIKNGFNDFLSKPIDTAELNTILERWIPIEKQGEEEHGVVVEESNAKQNIEISGVNTEKGIEISGGTVDAYLRTLSIFLGDSHKKIKEIKYCLEHGDIPLYTTHVHALKSAAANIGAGNLSKAAEKLEAAGHNGERDFILTHSGKLLLNLETLLCAIDKVVSMQKSKTENVNINMELLKTELPKLKTAMLDYDIATLNEASDNLQTFVQAPDIGDDIGKILQYKLVGKYDEAVVLIDKILHSLKIT